MDWSNASIKEIDYQIAELATLLKRKGYEGLFQVNGAPEEELAKGLQRHFGGENRRAAMQTHLNIKTNVYNHKSGESVTCSFKLFFRPVKGFLIEEMAIEKRQANWQLPVSKRIRPESWHHVPRPELVLQMAHQIEQQKKFKR